MLVHWSCVHANSAPLSPEQKRSRERINKPQIQDSDFIQTYSVFVLGVPSAAYASGYPWTTRVDPSWLVSVSVPFRSLVSIRQTGLSKSLERPKSRSS